MVSGLVPAVPCHPTRSVATAPSVRNASFCSALHGTRLSSPPRYFSIDVECVAVGLRHDARAVAQISLVDEHERVLLNLYVQPEVPVVSYLTPLTGLSREMLRDYGVPLATALTTLRHHLPSSGVLVGQNIGKDVDWLKLEEGRDFDSMVDLAGLYRVWNCRYGAYTVFSLEHLANVVLGIPNSGRPHNAVDDALKSMQLFNFYRQFGQDNSAVWETKQRRLLATKAPQSFARRFPRFEGVCMGHRKLCTCGAPFLG